MANHCLVGRAITVPFRLRLLNNPPHLRLFLIREFDVSRRPVLLQTLRLSGARNGNESLGSDPREGDLWQGAPLADGELLDLFDNGLVLVKVLSLELGGCGKS